MSIAPPPLSTYTPEWRLKQAIEIVVPAFIEELSPIVRADMSGDVVNMLMEHGPWGRVSSEIVNRKRYEWLVEQKYMNALSPEQVDEILREEEEDFVVTSWKELF